MIDINFVSDVGRVLVGEFINTRLTERAPAPKEEIIPLVEPKFQSNETRIREFDGATMLRIGYHEWCNIRFVK